MWGGPLCKIFKLFFRDNSISRPRLRFIASQLAGTLIKSKAIVCQYCLLGLGRTEARPEIWPAVMGFE